MNSFNGYLKKQYTLGNELGAGGEGKVYAVQGDSSIVAKIYRNEKIHSEKDRQTIERKLKTMIRMNIPYSIDNYLRIAWPCDILYDKGSLVGFIMPAVHADCKIFDVQRADPCRSASVGKDKFSKAYPEYTWKYQVQFAYNLAWVVNYLHSYNVVIGDLNQNNIYADTKTGAIVLIDCDSFDLKNPETGEHFPCTVGVDEFLAPELQKAHDLTKGTFTKETDNFSLAIHIFRLLMRNTDPFGGVMTIKESLSEKHTNEAIYKGECPYVRYVENKSVPSWSPTLDMLPEDIQELFKRTFKYNSDISQSQIRRRATAIEWCNALWKLAKPEPNRNLQKCINNRYHVYPASSKYCPWCRIQNNLKQQTESTKHQQSIKQQTNQNQSSQTVRSKTVSPNPPVYQIERNPVLFYVVLIAFGLASGFLLGGTFSRGVYNVLGIELEVNSCAKFLSFWGIISGALMAHHFRNRYVHALDAVPWLLLGFIELFVPLLIAVAVAIVIIIIMFITYIGLSPLGVIVIIFLAIRLLRKIKF